jgi:HAD superfamily hydrolase (TIGR01484 family)
MSRSTHASRPRPLAEMPARVRSAIRFVLTDIDDTLTSEGKLTALAYDALDRLHAAGKIVIPVTGRPAGWCDHIARMWPVDAVVGENGAFYMRFDPVLRKLVRRFVVADAERRRARARIAAIGRKILNAVPGSALASDQHYRETDLAIDYCEDVAPLSRADVDRIVTLMQAAGMTAKVSSIHVNGWFGDYDKLATTRTLLREAHAQDLDSVRDACVYAGDSPNDAPMFAFFPSSVGVANVQRFLDRIPTPPGYITTREAGAGFAELADALLEAG